MIVNPYNTTYGRLLNISNTIKDLMRYTVTCKDNIEYEYRSNEPMKTYFITGYNNVEANITPFDHPIIITDTKIPIVYTDLRKYVKSMANNTYELVPNYLTDIARDSSSINLLVLRAMATRDFYLDNVGLYRRFFKPFVQSFSTILTYAVDTIVKLNPTERVEVLYVTSGYSYSMLFSDESRPNVLDQAVAFISNLKLGVPVDTSYLKSKLEENLIFKSSLNIQVLVDSIKSCLPEGKRDYITIDTIANILSGIWYGHSGGEIVLIGLEDAPSWLSLIVSALVDTTYKKSRVTQILQNNRNISQSEVTKEYNLFIRERSV